MGRNDSTVSRIRGVYTTSFSGGISARSEKLLPVPGAAADMTGSDIMGSVITGLELSGRELSELEVIGLDITGSFDRRGETWSASVSA